MLNNKFHFNGGSNMIIDIPIEVTCNGVGKITPPPPEVKKESEEEET